jgi:hypothetical protein
MIDEFHTAVEKNDYYAVKALYKIDCTTFPYQDLFEMNVILSKRKVNVFSGVFL